jgi:cellobiose phosphorylase
MDRSNPKKARHVESAEQRAALNALARHAREVLRTGKPITEALSASELEKLSTRYSHFEDQRNEDGFLTASSHVITKVATPRPYIHIIGNNHLREYGSYGSFWDQSGAGFSCLDSIMAGSITSHRDISYVPTVPPATDHRHFFLREENPDTGKADIWHVFPQRRREEEAYDDFLCEQGLGTVKISSGRNRVAARLQVFVPVDDPLEVWRLTLTNRAKSKRRFKLFMWLNWSLNSYPSYYFEPRVVCLGRLNEKIHSLTAFNQDQNNKHPRSGFLMSREPFDGFDMSYEHFTGGGHSSIFPRAVEEGECSGSMGVQPAMGMVAAMQFDLEMEASESRTLDFLHGATDPEPAKADIHLEGLSRDYFKKDGIESRLEELEGSWNDMIGRELVKSPDDEVDRFYNVWSKYQAKSPPRLGRALDKVGYRDVLQDIMGINTFNPEYTAVMLPTTLRYQLADGRAIRQFAKFKNAPHDLRMYMDSSSWIADTLVGYIKETGDESILDREEGFYNMETDRVEEDNKATLYEHTLRGLKVLYEQRGLYGLCKIGHGDWNDALDGVGKDGDGVSVWLSMALVYAARKFRELTLRRKDSENTRLMDEIIEVVTDSINTNAWDGGHYVYAFMPDGTPVGSSSNPEGKIHLNVNTWSLFNGVAEKAGRVEKVIEAMVGLETSLGYLLLYPTYTNKSKQVGRIADHVAGLFENASLYTHGQSFAAYGLAELGNGEKALADIKKVLPSSTIPDISTGPLHQLTNFAVGVDHEQFGCHFYSNFTGSLAWFRKTLERMFGVMADFDGLVIDPCIPSSWKSYEVVKVFRGCRVKVSFSNPEGTCRGVVRATLDGEELKIEGGTAEIPLSLLSGRDEVKVDVLLGRI